MDAKGTNEVAQSLVDRLRKSWAGPAAVVGAFTAFSAAFFRVRPEPPKSGSPTALPILPSAAASSDVGDLPRAYTPVGVIGGSVSSRPFRRSLAGVAVGSGDNLYALGDTEIRIFDPAGAFLKAWAVPEWATCVAIGSAGRVFIAGGPRVEILDDSGRRVGGFAIDSGAVAPAVITSIRIHNEEVLAADATARLIFRCDTTGRRLGEIGTRAKGGRFMLPNRLLDFDVNPSGLVVATDPGRHSVTMWTADGALRSSFGKFGMSDPVDFVGCCNPVNVAWTPAGDIVTAEKMIARVKVYEPAGKLLAIIGPQHFDPQCTSIRLAVDSQARIITADTARRQISIFAPASERGAR